MAKRSTKLTAAAPAIAGPRHVQIARSSVAGKRPVDNAQPAGSLYVNFADKVLGYIDANGVHQDYVPSGGSSYTLPPASSTALGGVFSKSAPGGQYMTGIDTTGNPTFATPTYTAPVTSVNTKTGAVVLNYADVGAAAASHTHTEYAPVNHAHTGTPAAVSYYNETTGVMSSANNAYWVPNGPGGTLSIGYKTDPAISWPLQTGLQFGTDGNINQFAKSVGCLHYVNNSESVNTFPTFTGFTAWGIKEVFNPGGTNNSSVGHVQTNNKYDFMLCSSNNNSVVVGIANQNNGGYRECMRFNSGGGIGVNGAGWLGGGMSIMSSDTAFPLALGSSATPNDWWAVGPSWTSDGYFRISYKGQAGAPPGAGQPTNCYLTPTSQDWVVASDERLKDVIEPISNAVEKTKQLRSVIGMFKGDTNKTRHAFVMAQDVLKVLPEAVDAADPDHLGVQYTALIPLLIATINEQTKRIEDLEAMVGM